MKKHIDVKRFLSCVLCVVMLMSMAVPMSVSADTVEQSTTVGYDASLVKVPANIESIQDIKDYVEATHGSLTEFKITDIAGYKKFLELTSDTNLSKPGNDTHSKLYKFTGVTVYLATDLDFKNETGITPVGGWVANDGADNIMCPGWSGIFDGLGHTIKNLELVAPDGIDNSLFGEGYIGLFRSLTRHGSIKNLILDSTVTVSAGNWNTAAVAALVGSINTNSPDNAKISLSISNIWNKATVVGQANNAGSLVGRVYQATLDISNCTNEGSVSTNAFVEGKDDYKNDPTTFGYGVGGFIGIVGTASSGADRTTNISISDCVNNGTITSDHSPVGGIVGAVGEEQNSDKLQLTIDNCVNSGKLVQNSDNNVGGILGVNNNINDNVISVTNSAFSGTIENNGKGYVDPISTGANVSLSDNRFDSLDSANMEIYGVQPSLERYTLREGNNAYDAFSVRVISLHNDISNLNKISYNVTLTLGEDKYFSAYDTNKVYTSLIADGETKTASTLGGEFLATLRIDDIPIEENESISVSVVPVVTDVNGKTYFGSPSDFSVSIPKSDDISAMTFNIYNWDTSEEHLTRIKTVIKTFRPDLIGFQEITDIWITNIMEDSEISAMYGEVGDSREDDTQEQCAIFYRKDKFELISYDTKWLYGDSNSTGSDTAGKLEKSLYNRIYTYAVLERLSDGKRIAHVNIHLDLSDDTNRNAVQSQQVTYALNMAEQLMLDENISAVVLTGDFNTKKKDAACSLITDAGFVHAEDGAYVKMGSIVEGEYYKGDTTKPICKWIDHVFIKGEGVYIKEYEICNQKYDGEYASDHLPRIARFVLR